MFTRWKSGFHRFAPPRPGAVFRISIGAALLRTRLDTAFQHNWRFDPPLSGARFDLEPGTQVVGEYPSPNGLLRFRSVISEVEESGHFSIKTPRSTRLVERRSEPRNLRPGQVSIENLPATCIDLSPIGGRFETECGARKGERIRLDFPQISEPVFGWVLETYPNQMRVRFEQRIPSRK
jgi:hypothetical protein